MKENNKSTKILVISMLWLLFLLIVWVSLWDKYSKDTTNTTEVTNLDKKEEKITKEDYLKEKWVTDFREDFQEKKEEYYNEISKAPSKRETYLYLWHTEDSLLFQAIHSDVKYQELKKVFDKLSSDEIESYSNKLKLSPIQIKKLDLLELKVFDPFILEYQVDYINKDRKVVNFYKAKNYKYHFSEISKTELEKLLPSQSYISLIWLFERKFLKDDLLKIVNNVATKERCSLWAENQTKKYIHESNYLELYDQQSCDKIVIWYFETLSWEKLLERVYIDSFYTWEEKQVYLENYKTAGIETTWDNIIMTKLYYELNKKYPYVFF